MTAGPTQNVFDVVLLRQPAAGAGGLAHLAWRARRQGERVVQVYVDGERYDATADPADRATWLQLDPSRDHAVELLAVEPAERWRDYSDRLEGWAPALRLGVTVALRRDETLPIDAAVAVAVDGRLVDRRPLWSGGDHRGGFGGLFGEGGVRV